MRTPTCFLSPLLEGRRIADRGGRGVFAKGRVQAGKLLAAWGGDVVDREWLRQAGHRLTRLAVQIDENLFLVPARQGPADWFNHSCAPNAGLRGQIVLVAMRDIEAGEEVCYDYAMSDGSDYDEIDCQCGALTCRGRITGEDWRDPDLMERYAGYFSPYLQHRIELERKRRAWPDVLPAVRSA